ncbi:hypothetical protein [Nocardia donostiensis]|uniref:hypothetical protein n=1 Tax=Nocardia donostiensis TaxID=1538463 RepID=UPI0009D963E3|nr:hypothetical protein [Nocardia donostiensis]
MKLARGISGIVAAGVVLLAFVVVGAAFLGARRGFPGPGGVSVIWHVVIAAIAIAAQVFSDRQRGAAAFAASAAVVLAAGVLLWTQWWG